MHYMARWADARASLDRLLPGTRSVIVVLKSYNDDPTRREPTPAALVSRYACREDYHQVLKQAVRRLAEQLARVLPDARWRPVVDTAPLLEREFAWLAGLGWIGKNTMLINRTLGSWVFIGALLTTAEIEPDEPFAADHCGRCTRCLDACPTEALREPRLLDARRCIAYLTIETRGPLDERDRDKLNGWLFGCDICQEVCPWNRKALPTAHPMLPRRSELDSLSDPVAVLDMPDDELGHLIERTPLERAGVVGLKRNAALLLTESADPRADGALRRALTHSSDVVRDAARWALQRRAERHSPATHKSSLRAGRCAGAARSDPVPPKRTSRPAVQPAKSG